MKLNLFKLFGSNNGHVSHLYLFQDDERHFYALTDASDDKPSRLKLKQRPLEALGKIQTNFQGLHPEGTVIYGVPPEDLLQRVKHIWTDEKTERAFHLQGDRYQRLRPLQARVTLAP